jgi:hypothetical protein
MKVINKHLLTPETKIEQIRIAFEIYALGDIQGNIKEKPIASFILGSCLIDQLATFAYNVDETSDHRYYYQLFIKNYFLKYKHLGEQIYKSLRCKLVHGYTVDEFLKIMSESDVIDNDTRHTHTNALTARTLYNELVSAWGKLKSELLVEGSCARINALARFDIAPPLVEAEYQVLRYSKEEAEYLCKFYREKMIGKLINSNPQLVITSLEIHEFKGEMTDNLQDKYIVVAVAKKSKTERLIEHLDAIARQFQMQHPLEILRHIH